MSRRWIVNEQPIEALSPNGAHKALRHAIGLGKVRMTWLKRHGLPAELLSNISVEALVAKAAE